MIQKASAVSSIVLSFELSLGPFGFPPPLLAMRPVFDLSVNKLNIRKTLMEPPWESGLEN